MKNFKSIPNLSENFELILLSSCGMFWKYDTKDFPNACSFLYEDFENSIRKIWSKEIVIWSKLLPLFHRTNVTDFVDCLSRKDFEL